MHIKNAITSLFKPSFVWLVVVDEARDYELSFESQRLAKIYKKSLADSHKRLKSRIVKVEFAGDYIVEKREV